MAVYSLPGCMSLHCKKIFGGGADQGGDDEGEPRIPLSEEPQTLIETPFICIFFNIYWSLSVKLQVCISLVLFFLRNCFCASKVTFMYVVHYCHKHTEDRYPKCRSLLKGKSKSHGQPGKGQNPTKQSKTNHKQTWKQTSKWWHETTTPYTY